MSCKLVFGRRKLVPISVGTCSAVFVVVVILYMAARICKEVRMFARWRDRDQSVVYYVDTALKIRGYFSLLRGATNLRLVRGLQRFDSAH